MAGIEKGKVYQGRANTRCPQVVFQASSSIKTFKTEKKRGSCPSSAFE
jgi:hypothetical protein